MKNKLIYLGVILGVVVACKKETVTPTQPTAQVTVNGKTLNTSETTPSDSGQFVTLYYDTLKNLMSLNIKDGKTKDDVVLLVYTDVSLNNVKTKLNVPQKYEAYYNSGTDTVNLMNKKVSGDLNISELILEKKKVKSFSGDFSFTQTSKDVYDSVHVHKIEGAKIIGMKQTE
ncbi:MAG: hypothetical protein U0V72_02915 [Cytophagales bacterium]